MTRSRATILAASGPRSLSSNARTRSIPAVIPADVQIGPSLMKIRSSSTRTSGNRDRKSSAWAQCIVARRPVEEPCLGEHEGTTADRCGSPGGFGRCLHERDQIRSRWRSLKMSVRAHDHCIEDRISNRSVSRCIPEEDLTDPPAPKADARHTQVRLQPVSDLKYRQRRDADHLKSCGTTKPTRCMSTPVKGARTRCVTNGGKNDLSRSERKSYFRSANGGDRPRC